VVFLGKLAVSGLDLRFACVFAHAQYAVRIFSHIYANALEAVE
jgi:hypothetical protein